MLSVSLIAVLLVVMQSGLAVVMGALILAGVAFLVLRLPLYQVYLAMLALITPFSIFDIFKVPLGSIRPSLPFGLFGLLFIPLLLQLAQPVNDLVRNKRHPLRKEAFLFAIFLLVAFASVLVSTDRADTLIEVVQMAAFFVVYLLIANAIRTQQELVRSLMFYVIGVLIALFAGWLFTPFFVRNRINFWGAHPNHIGIIVEQGLIVAFGLFLSWKRPRNKLLALSLAFLLSLALILTFSRGAYVSAAIGIGLLLWLARHRIDQRTVVLLVIAAALLLGVVMFAVPQLPVGTLVDRVGQVELLAGNLIRFGDSNQLRANIWSQYFQQFLQSPWIGFGFASQASVRGETIGAHNSYLGLLVGVGVIGLAAVLLYFIDHFRNLTRARIWVAQAGSPLGNIFLAMFVAFLVHFMVENAFNASFFWMLMGWQGAASNVAVVEMGERDQEYRDRKDEEAMG